MAITIMGYFSLRQTAAQAECSSRLRHIYQSTLKFVADHDGLMYPDLGPRTDIRHDYNYNAWWWSQAYLARYVLDDMRRRKDSVGLLSQAEAEPFNCPLRFVDGTDLQFTQSNNNPGTSYIMRRQTAATSTSSPAYRIDFQFYNINEPSRQVMITEGRGRIAARSQAYTGSGVGGNNRLRRYHKGGLNILFYDGRVELFRGEDDVLQREFWQPLRP